MKMMKHGRSSRLCGIILLNFYRPWSHAEPGHRAIQTMSSLGVASVETYTNLLEDLLRTAQVLRPGDSVDPVLRIEDFGGGIEKVGAVSPTVGHKSYAAIETACRNTFYSLLVSTELISRTE